MDKGYYDYDYEAVKEKPKAAAKHEQSVERTQQMLTRFGFGEAKKIATEPRTAEQLQSEAMAEEQKKQRVTTH